MIIDKKLNYGRHHIANFTKNLPAGAIAVDLGAGHGDDLLITKSNNPNILLHAIETYPPYQQELKSNNIIVHSCNLENDKLPFKDESVDLIICNQIIEHCKEIWWIMNEITRILKVGGRLVIGVPNLASLHNRLLLLLGNQPTSIQNDSSHLRGYTKNDLSKFVIKISDRGYKLKKFGGSNFYPFPPIIAKPLAAIFPTMAWSNFFWFEKTKRHSNKFINFLQNNRLETNFYLGS